MFCKSLIISITDCIKSNKKQKGIDNSAIHEGRFNRLPVVLPLNNES